jgi:outer membrane protein
MKLKRLSLALSLLCSLVPLAHAAEPAGTTLEDFFTAALDYSPALKSAQAKWDVGNARVDFATGQLLPQVTASANVSDNTREDSRNGEQDYRGKRYSVQLSQVLYEAEYFMQLAQVLTVVADNYLLVLEAEDMVGSIRSELEAITNQVNQIQRMNDLQLAKITDLYNGQAQQAAIQAQLVDAESELTIRKENLRASTGL